jgi:hypothetical protein
VNRNIYTAIAIGIVILVAVALLMPGTDDNAREKATPPATTTEPTTSQPSTAAPPMTTEPAPTTPSTQPSTTQPSTSQSAQ